MPDNENSRKAGVTLERLIQLKRSERPESAFWDDFDREFHQRRLAALVATTPWHARAGQMLMIVLRRTAPVGAAAAALAAGYLALTHETAHTPAASAVAAAPAETVYTLLPEERVATATQTSPVSAPLDRETFRVRSHNALHEIGIAPVPSRSFVTVASPHSLSLADGESSGYRVLRTLTTTPAFQGPALPAGSF